MFDWAQNIADWFIYEVFHLTRAPKAGDALIFLVFVTIKSFILLLFITLLFVIIIYYIRIE